MKCKVLRGLRILLSLVALAAVGSRTEGLSLMVQQISTIGARQWLGLMVGSIVAGAPVIAPLSGPHRPFAGLPSQPSRGARH
jgi:hypothetical protein